MNGQSDTLNPGQGDINGNGNAYSYAYGHDHDLPPTPVPEPSTALVFGTIVVAFLVMRFVTMRKRQRA